MEERCFQMPIRSKEDLIDKIGIDHIWRIREISELKSLVEGRTVSDIRKKVLCRSGIALLYAHWEGFVKKSGTYFLEYVSNQRLSMAELKSNFVTLSIREKIDQASDSRKYSTFDQITQYIIQNKLVRVRIPVKNIVDTKSNLSTVALKEIIWCLGLDYYHFEAKEKLIDTKLVGRRNHVAHGELIQIDVDDFIEMVDEVLGLMTIFKNLLENAAVLEQYKTEVNSNKASHMV